MIEMHRRTVLQGMAGLAVLGAEAPLKAAEPIGRPGDFDFLTGEWRIHNRMIKPGSEAEWIEFPGEATVYRILNGVGSVEGLRIPARKFSGMGLRLLDVEKRVWNDHWVNAASGVVSVPGQQGVFRNGVGRSPAKRRSTACITSTAACGINVPLVAGNVARWRQDVGRQLVYALDSNPVMGRGGRGDHGAIDPSRIRGVGELLQSQADGGARREAARAARI